MVRGLVGIRSIDELEAGPAGEGGGLAGKRVFVRVNFDLPLRGDEVVDDTRIREVLPTIQFAVEAGAKVILGSHRGRPAGKRGPHLSLEPAGARLAELSGYEVHLPEDCVGDAPKMVIRDLRALQRGATLRGTPQICLLENLRYHAGEAEDDDTFARALGELIDVYVNDAFSTVHHAHASVHALPRLMRDRAAGRSLLKQLQVLDRLIDNPTPPYVAVLGGANLSDKVDLIEALLPRADMLLIGGAMANTFLAARGTNMQQSRVEEDKLALARTLLNKARDGKVEVVLPSDLLVGESPTATAPTMVSPDTIPEGTAAFDIGPATIERFGTAVGNAGTIFWNGPMGLCENEAFATGTRRIAELLAKQSGFAVVVGDDTAAAVRRGGGEVLEGFDHVSTGGGASLRFIEGRKLPGLEALRQTH